MHAPTLSTMRSLALGLPLLLAIAGPGWAAETGASPQAQDATELVDAEVRKVDKAHARITLRHSPINSLNMPAMTMVFRVSNPAMLDLVQAGDAVRFSVRRLNGQLTLTHLERRP